ncbi:hypothetical protein K1719_046991, partial [Acacia pycnantha]
MSEADLIQIRKKLGASSDSYGQPFNCSPRSAFSVTYSYPKRSMLANSATRASIVARCSGELDDGSEAKERLVTFSNIRDLTCGILAACTVTVAVAFPVIAASQIR